MTKQQFIDWALSHGWHTDRFGHLQKTGTDTEGNPRDYRFKLSSTHVRWEIKIHLDGSQYSKPENKWVWLAGGYYKDISVNGDGKLHGLRRQI